MREVELVHVHVETAVHDQAKRPQIVDAMGVIGVRMAQKDTVEPLDAGLEQLLAQVGRSVDQDSGRAGGAERSSSTEQRRRRFFGFAGSQSPHPCPTRGTPPDEPQPRMVSRSVNATVRRPGEAWKKAERIRARRRSERLGLNPARFGDHARRGDDEGRLVAAAAMRNRRKVGRVGLDQNAVERDIARDGAQILRLLERHDAGKRDREPEVKRRLGEFDAKR